MTALKPYWLRPYLFFIFCPVFFTATLSAQPARVSENGRYLETADGTPFFYLGDTAWELFHRLNREEADRYLTDRAEKGFTVIQAVILAQINGLTDPNANGDLPLVDSDPTQPVEAYFEHVDYIVRKAASLGLTIGMLPTWGNYWNSIAPDDIIFTPENARSFGSYLGKRYREDPIIWILGGDHNVHTPKDKAIIEAMVAGLKAGDGGAHLVTYHPRGPGLSSDYFHTSDWLDFNMYQSSHGGHDHDNGLYAEHDRALEPAKPTLDGEPRYERIPTGFYFDGFNRQDRFDDDDSRQAAYWSVLAGACGHTYGHNSIWQMYAPERTPIIGAITPWYEALDHPGSLQMKYLRQLFENYSFAKLQPAQELVLNGPDRGGSKIRSAIADDRSYALVYTPKGESFTIDKSRIEGNHISESWFDPRYGVTYRIHSGDTKGIQTYTPPTSGRGQDWILIIENAARE